MAYHMPPVHIIEGYAPSDLLDRLQRAPWVPCAGGGNNFNAIDMSGFALTDTADTMANIKYRITVDTVPKSRKSFTIEGYHSAGLYYRLKNEEEPITFDGSAIQDFTLYQIPPDFDAFRATIAMIAIHFLKKPTP